MLQAACGWFAVTICCIESIFCYCHSPSGTLSESAAKFALTTALARHTEYSCIVCLTQQNAFCKEKICKKLEPLLERKHLIYIDMCHAVQYRK